MPALLFCYGGHGYFSGHEAKTTGRNDTAILIAELDIQFGGGHVSGNDNEIGGDATVHSCFNGDWTGARFWTSSKPLAERLWLDRAVKSGLYYILFPGGGLAIRSQENEFEAFSVRCVKN
jgi:hypothetical protein